MSDTFAEVKRILRSVCGEARDLRPETNLVTDLGLDSMKVMQLLLETEERFDISIPLNIIPNVRTAGDFARQIEQLTERR